MQVSDVYRRPNFDSSSAKFRVDEMANMVDNGVQLLGQIKHGSCRPRAILFKVLADAVGLECKLMVVKAPFLSIKFSPSPNNEIKICLDSTVVLFSVN